MASNKNPSTAGRPTLKIGSRVRCTDNGLEGRIVWANGVSVKIAWDNGQQVTWRRDSLADRPIEILGEDDVQAATPVPAAIAPVAPAALAPAESPAADTPFTPPETAQEPPAAETPAPEPTTGEAAPAAPDSATAAEPASAGDGSPDAANAATTDAGPTVARLHPQRPTSAGPKEKKLGALDSAAQVFG